MTQFKRLARSGNMQSTRPQVRLRPEVFLEMTGQLQISVQTLTTLAASRAFTRRN